MRQLFGTDFPFRKLNSGAGLTLCGRSDGKNAPSIEGFIKRLMQPVDATEAGIGSAVVECELVDASGRRHTLRDKVSIFSQDSLDASGDYPQPGVADCEVLARWKNEQGRQVAHITTVRPFDIESVEGLSEFAVLSSQRTAATGKAV